MNCRLPDELVTNHPLASQAGEAANLAAGSLLKARWMDFIQFHQKEADWNRLKIQSPLRCLRRLLYYGLLIKCKPEKRYFASGRRNVCFYLPHFQTFLIPHGCVSWMIRAQRTHLSGKLSDFILVLHFLPLSPLQTGTFVFSALCQRVVVSSVPSPPHHPWWVVAVSLCLVTSPRGQLGSPGQQQGQRQYVPSKRKQAPSPTALPQLVFLAESSKFIILDTVYRVANDSQPSTQRRRKRTWTNFGAFMSSATSDAPPWDGETCQRW